MAGPIPDSWVVDPTTATARELAPGLWRLRLPWSWEGVDHVNAYLLTDGTEHALVDCGPAGDPSCLAALEHALDLTGVPLEAIDRLILTHAHSDHVGQARELVVRGGAQVWRHPATEHVDVILTEPTRSAARRRRRAFAEGVPEDQLAWFDDVREETDTIVAPLRGDHPLGNGVVVPSPLGPLHVISTPGHAPSQVALVQPELGLAIVGDTVCSVFSPYCDYGFSADPVGELLDSLDRLEALGPLPLVLPGHGRPLADLPLVLEQHRTGIDDGLSKTYAAVTAGPAGAYDIARRIFGPAPTAFTTFSRTTLVACYLRHLRVRGDVVRVTSADGRFRYQPSARA